MKNGFDRIASVVALIFLTSMADLRFGLDTRTTGDYFAIGLAILLMAIVGYTLWHTLFCHRTKVLNAVMEESKTSAKIFAILIGATFFSLCSANWVGMKWLVPNFRRGHYCPTDFGDGGDFHFRHVPRFY